MIRDLLIKCAPRSHPVNGQLLDPLTETYTHNAFMVRDGPVNTIRVVSVTSQDG